jgi:hypothetical protein
MGLKMWLSLQAIVSTVVLVTQALGLGQIVLTGTQDKVKCQAVVRIVMLHMGFVLGKFF